MASNGRATDRRGSEEQEVPLTGLLAEFRDALRAEMEAARRAAQSSAVQLINGERIGRSADGRQYLFKLESPQLALPDDMPGDLYVKGRERVDATVISLTGTALTLDVREDLGQHVARASLSSNMTNLLRALVQRIEQVAVDGRDNPAGDRLLGQAPAGGVAIDPAALEGLNAEQAAAVASGLGRDVTFIQGPPGTGKTKVIGTLGERLARAGRSVLLVSHTNTAVDQALLHVGRALGPEMAAEGKVLRLGQPKDERVLAQPDLLVATHVERRSAELVARRDELEAERGSHTARLADIEFLLKLCRWADGAAGRQQARDRAWTEVSDLRAHADALQADVDGERDQAGEWERTRTAARQAVAEEQRREQLVDSLTEAKQEARDRRAARPGVEAQAAAEADQLLAGARQRIDQWRATAHEAVTGAEAESHARRHDLDMARQVRLMTGRFAQLPSVAFSEERVAKVRSDLSAAQDVQAAVEVEAEGARRLLIQTEGANAMTRRLRRLPAVAEQQHALAQVERRASDARSQAGAAAMRLQEAERQVAEILWLMNELDRLGDHPSVDDAEANLLLAERALDDARRGVDEVEREATRLLSDADAVGRRLIAETPVQADREIANADAHVAEVRGRVDECLAALAAFEAEHGDQPAAVLARAEQALARFDELTAQLAEATGRLADLDRRLREEADGERQVLRLADRPVTDSDDLPELVADLRRAVAEAMSLAADQDPGALQQEATTLGERLREIAAEAASINQQLETVQVAVVADAMVLATTLTRAYLRDEVQDRRFDTVILDEASMAPIPALWVAALVAEANVVLVGDPLQLPPIALAADGKDPDAPASRWLGRDVFEASKVLDGPPPAHMVALRTQYRMHPAISAAPNALVYGGALRDDPSTLADNGLDPWYVRDWGHDAPVLLVDTERADAWCSTVTAAGRSSRLNFLSATIAVGLAERVLRADRRPPQRGEARVLIATPYRPQARLVTLLLRDAGLEGEVLAGTVHSFQGSEAPVVIYDLVVDEPHRRAGLFDPTYDDEQKRQFNVGLTRARHRLFVIGDLKFLQTNGRRAFIARLLRELDGAQKVDAEDVVPLGLSARAAHAQGLATGNQAEPAGADRVVLTQRDFDEFFLADVNAAQQELVVYSPFITANRLDVVGPALRAAVERGVAVYVVTKTLEDRNKGDTAYYRELMEVLQRWGITIVPKKAMHEKLVFVDDDVVWVGSLNPLSFRDTREIMERRRSRKVADDYRKTLQVEVAFSAYKEGETSCPICGSAMALAEGPRGTYRRCVVTGCYSRGLSDPPLHDGKMACHTCGGELYYGAWGKEPAWRCRENARHRMAVHANHLRLPAMAGLLTKGELRKLQGMFVRSHTG